MLSRIVFTLSHTIWNLGQAWPHVGCRQNLQCFGMVSPSTIQGKDSHAAALGTQGRLGWPCAWWDPWHLAAKENRATLAVTESNPMMLPQHEISRLSTEIHGFSDASELAYAAVVYLRITDASNQVHISLVMSKSRVAPIKRLTIPRLAMWSTIASSTHSPRQTSPWCLSISCTCLFVASKTRVAPICSQTIPRLELLSAPLLA